MLGLYRLRPVAAIFTLLGDFLRLEFRLRHERKFVTGHQFSPREGDRIVGRQDPRMFYWEGCNVRNASDGQWCNLAEMTRLTGYQKANQYQSMRLCLIHGVRVRLTPKGELQYLREDVE